jgi:hypothetical protein
MPGRSQVKVGGGVVDVEVVVVDVVAVPVVAVVVVDVDVVVTAVDVVVGVGLEQEVLHRRANVCWLAAFSFWSQFGHEAGMSRKAMRRQFLSPIFLVRWHFRTQLRTIVHRPPLVERQFFCSEILPMHSA